MSMQFKKFKHPLVIIFLVCLLSKFQNTISVATNYSRKSTSSSTASSSSPSASSSSSSSTSSAKEPDRAESEARLVQINDVNRYSIQPQNHLLSKWHADEWLKYETNFVFNYTRVQHIEAECQDDYMKIRVNFNGSFTGLLYSTGYAYDPDCVYVNGSGKEYYEFYIQLNRCGTLGQNALNQNNIKNPTNFMWNTITVQYNPLIEEDYDEHFKVTCEYGYDFWKTVTFPFIDVEVATGNPVVFTLSPPECYMEVKNGYDANGPRVIGPVRVGDPLTLVIYMRSKYDGFDMIVSDCYAHNGAQKRIQLISEDGCPVDDKLISRFRGTWTDSGFYETQIYAYMKTFRFTGSPALYIECDVRMCHGRCPGQTCHWRNLKQLSKRDLQDQTNPENKLLSNLNEKTQLEGVNLFQSLRVLEEDDTTSSSKLSRYHGPDAHHSETCLELSVFSALCTLFLIFVSLLAITLLITYMKLREQKAINGV